MARIALEIPKVGLVMENARVVRWLKQVGDRVAQGEPLLELETEKSVVEIEATADGRLVEILLQPDQQASVGDQVGWLEDDTSAASSPTGAAVAPSNTAAPANVAVSPSIAPALAGSSDSGSSVTAPERLRSSPAARRLAAEHSIDLHLVTPTGPRGRIQLSDIRSAIQHNSAATPAESQASTACPGLHPLSNMRRAIARAMTLSNATIPQFIVERSVDWSTVDQRRAAGQPGSINDLLLHAVAAALRAFPDLNATFEGDTDFLSAAVRRADGAHIGLVVAVEGGVIIPVFHNVHQLNLTDLARHRDDLIKRALSGKLKRDELQGATISISNLGASGPDRFTAMISPSQSAILAVGRRRECAVVRDGGIHVKPLSHLTLTVDHRVADGRLAADFLGHIVAVLEGANS